MRNIYNNFSDCFVFQIAQNCGMIVTKGYIEGNLHYDKQKFYGYSVFVRLRSSGS